MMLVTYCWWIVAVILLTNSTIVNSAENPIRGTTEKVRVEKVVGNIIYTTDGRKFKTDRRTGYIPRQYYREYQLKGKELTIRHDGSDLLRKYQYVDIESELRK
ncbi:hypothetical protein K0504_04555 [Neiella marina]|uniref:Uncharacterized protein n=1 Tax=Neiella holothuriorum TaxID=2870530 RepID=A0ABS7ED93_9GAMM|nr:hypothetical protein [Neiella holothuriorum]MBW8190300.1 hypothetical protein [Neiella holothuriorum]